MQIRINNIGVKPPAYIGTPPENAHRTLSVVQYYPCRYYGKLEEYLASGWVEESTALYKDNCSVSKNLFALSELCLGIASIVYNPKELCTDLKSVGERLLNLSKKDRNDFFEVYEIAVKKLAEACSDEDINLCG